MHETETVKSIEKEIISDVPEIVYLLLTDKVDTNSLSIWESLSLHKPLKYQKHLSKVLEAIIMSKMRTRSNNSCGLMIETTDEVYPYSKEFINECEIRDFAKQCLYSYRNGKEPSKKKAKAFAIVFTTLFLDRFDHDGKLLRKITQQSPSEFLENFSNLLQILPTKKHCIIYRISYVIETGVNSWIYDNVLSNKDVIEVLIGHYEECAKPNVSPNLLQQFARDLRDLDTGSQKIYDVTKQSTGMDTVLHIAENNHKQQSLARAMKGHFKDPDDGKRSYNRDSMVENQIQRYSLVCNLIPVWFEKNNLRAYLKKLFPNSKREDIPFELYYILLGESTGWNPYSYLYSHIKGGLIPHEITIPPEKVLDKAREHPLFQYLLQKEIVSKRQDLILELLRCSLHINKDQKSIWITSPLSAYQRDIQQSFDRLMASGKMYYSFNCMIVILGTIAAYVNPYKQKIFDFRGSKKAIKQLLKDEYEQWERKNNKTLYQAWTNVLCDALANFELVWNDLANNFELHNFLFQEKQNNCLAFYTKYLRLYWDALYTSLKLNLCHADADICVNEFETRIRKVTARFVEPSMPFDHLSHIQPHKGAYDTIIGFLYFAVEALDECVREEVLMKLCSRSAIADPQYRPVADAISAYLTYALIGDRNVNVTKSNYKLILQTLFGNRNYWFMNDVFEHLVCQSTERRSFFVEHIFDSLHVESLNDNRTSSKVPPLYMMYSSPLKNDLTKCDVPAMRFLVDADTIRRESYSHDLLKSDTRPIMTKITIMANEFLKNCWNELLDENNTIHIDRLEEEKNGTIINRCGYVFGMDLLGYCGSNLLIKNHSLNVSKRLLSAVIYADYLTRKIHPSYEMKHNYPIESLYCGAYRLVCQIRKFDQNYVVPLPKQAEMDYVCWITDETTRYRQLLLRLLSYTSAFKSMRDEIINACKNDLEKDISFLAYDNIAPFAADKNSRMKNESFLKNPRILQLHSSLQRS